MGNSVYGNSSYENKSYKNKYRRNILNSTTGKFIFRNFIKMLLLLFAVSIAAFALMTASPIDPLKANVGQTALGSMSQEQIAKLEEYWSVGKPPVQRYLAWFKDFVRGDMGVSLLYRQKVTTVIAVKLGNSLFLMITAWVLSGLIGFLLGALSGMKRGKTIDKVIPVPEVFFVSWTKSLINCLSVDAWAKVGVVCFFLLLASLYFFFFSKQIVWKKIGFIAGIVFLVLVLLANVFAFQQKNELLNRNNAIVLTPSVTVRSTPSESGTSLFILHEGRKVEIKDNSMREWKEIRLEDGKVGWVPASSVEVI